MNCHPSRRKVLAAGGSVVLGTVAGCSQLSFTASSPTQLEVLPRNTTSEQQLLEVTLLRPADETREEAVVFDREFELDADESASQNPPVVDDERYLVRADLAGYRDVDAHYHHFPDPNERVEGPRLLEVGVFSEDELVRPYIDFTEYAGRSD